MRRSSLSALAFLIVALVSLQIASAQFPRLPKIPKPNQPKPTPTPNAQPATTTDAPQPAQPDSRNETKPATTAAAAGEDAPTIAKDSIQLTPWTNNSYRGSFDTWSWVPKIEFRVNGPIPSGSQLYVEYTIPGSAAVKCR